MKLRLMSLIRKEFIQIVRDPRTLGLTLLYPLFMLFVLGFAFTDNVSSISVAVLDQDQSSQSRALLTAYRVSDYFALDHFVANEDEMNHLIESNEVLAAIIIPPDYSKELVARRVAQVGFIIDGSNPTTASTALSAAATIGQLHATRIVAERTMRSRPTQLPIDVRTQVWYNPDMVNTHFMIPALIGMILQFLLTFLTAISIVRERERGTIEQLIVTPIRSWELIAWQADSIRANWLLRYRGSPGDRRTGFPRANQWQPGSALAASFSFPGDHPGAWPVDFDDGKYPSGGHADHHVFPLARNIPLRIYVSSGYNAHYSPDC